MGHGTFYFILLIISQVEHVHVKHKQQDPKKTKRTGNNPRGIAKKRTKSLSSGSPKRADVEMKFFLSE